MSAHLTSVRSERVTFVRRLHDRSVRRERGLFVVEGAQGVNEALATPAVVEQLYVAESAASKWPDLPVDVTIATDDVLAAMSQTENPQGVLAVCRLVDVSWDAIPQTPRLVAVLHQANDPGNAGTIVRSADAFGADAVIFTTGSVDAYNGKCVRATAGSLFHVPIVLGVELTDVVELLHDRGMCIRATDGAGETSLEDVDLTEPSAWLIGTEAHGLGAHALGLADERVRIPMVGAAESVNAGVAASIVLYRSSIAGGRASG